MNEETNQETSIGVQGTITVTVNLKGSKRRYSPPDMKVEIPFNFGGKLTGFEEKILDQEIASLRRRILIACGQVGMEE